MYEQSVNIKNPVEINLLFVQSRDGILEGAYPVTMEESCKVCRFSTHLTENLFKTLCRKGDCCIWYAHIVVV